MRRILVSLAVCCSLFFISCRKETFHETIPSEPPVMGLEEGGEGEYHEGEIVLGERLKNPYNVRNMKLAYSTLRKSGTYECDQVEVRATHYYVKFLPASLDQYEVLDSDTTIHLSEYPLDYSILQEGNNYHDPRVPDGEVTYQYTAVPVDYKFIDTIKYEILDTLYIPEEDPKLVNKDEDDDDNPNWDCIDNLLDQAYYQTGNYDDMMDPSNHQKTAPARYHPAGRIQIFDTRLGTNIGMEGVRVQARRWFTIHNARPDVNGFFRARGTFRRPCNYSVWFATPWFAVRKHLINTTYWINGPKKTGDWNPTVADGYARFAGHIFRGAFRYHYKDIAGLRRPYRPWYQRQLYIGVNKDKDWSGVNWQILPVIRIARYFGDNQEYGSDEIFSTTCHETAHTSHALLMNWGLVQYIQVTTQLQESWPVAVEWLLTHMEYADRGIANYGEWNYNPPNPPQYPNRFAYQYWNQGISGDYTSLFINLEDNHNELGQTYGFLTGSVDDEVTGYTLSFIESNILKHSYGLSSLGNELKANKPAGVTDAQIDQLLSFY